MTLLTDFVRNYYFEMQFYTDNYTVSQSRLQMYDGYIIHKKITSLIKYS
jgi:hypothetical protein